MSRKVGIFTTIGENYKEIYTSAATWGSLTEDLTSNSINWKGMKAVNGEDQHTYDSSEAILPDGDFTIFLMADKVKSGYNDQDDDLIDEFHGIVWSEENWESDTINVEDYTFATRNDLMMARAKKAAYYLNKVMDFISGEKSHNTSPRKNNSLVNTMKEQAERLRKNLSNVDFD